MKIEVKPWNFGLTLTVPVSCPLSPSQTLYPFSPLTLTLTLSRSLTLTRA